MHPRQHTVAAAVALLEGVLAEGQPVGTHLETWLEEGHDLGDLLHHAAAKRRNNRALRLRRLYLRSA